MIQRCDEHLERQVERGPTDSRRARMEILRTARLLALVGALLGIGACDDDDEPTGPPTVASVAGNYRATAFTYTYQYPLTSPAVTTDVLATGGSCTFLLAADGAVVGNMKIPTEGFNFTFAGGTWELTGDQVVFGDIPGTVTFIEDLVFDVRGNTLTTDHILDPYSRIHLVMTKQ